ncbi:MAG TPA: hypothetical protein V6C69_20230 [Trichormus sp.]|jgi:hypothetical protein
MTVTVLPKRKNSLALSGLIAGLICFCAGVAYVAFPHGLHSSGECPLFDALAGKIIPAVGMLFVIVVACIKASRAEMKSPLRRMIVCGPAPFFLLLLAIGFAVVFARLIDK